ncbi:MAG: asparaginase [Burkholderiales bacterium]|nr:asparaginase [Burkholderiales bacterium]
MSQKIVFLGMGGTIAGKAASPDDNVGYKAAQVGVQELLAAVPGLAAVLGGWEATAEQVVQLDSKDMHNVAWRALALRAMHYLAMPDVAGLVVTHGTDTLEETAYFLSRVLPAGLLGAKPVIMTCAMRPATSQLPDGPQNMLDATVVACTPGARGVTVVCAGVVHDARHVRKVHPYRLNPFDSGEAGPLGFVEEGIVRLVHAWPAAAIAAVPSGNLESAHWPRVEIVLSHAGATGALVRSMAAHPGADPVCGIVVAGTGNGSIHQDLEAALREVQAQGVHVVRSTRCALGQIVGNPRGDVSHFGVTDLDPFKARIALMLDLMV